MILTPNDVIGDTLAADVVIIGGGATGLALASRLRRDVLVIEGGGLDQDPARDHQFRILQTGAHSENWMMRRRRVGGLGGWWYGRCAELNPIDFEVREGIDHSGWPVSAGEMAPWFRAARRDLGLSEREAADIGAYLEPAPDLTPQIWLYAREAREKPLDLGRHFLPHFKRSDKRLLTQADVVRLAGDGRRLSHVEVVARDGRRLRIEGREFVLACGCVEASRLLLDAEESCAELLAPVRGWLGKGFHQHLLLDGGRIEADARQAATLQHVFNRIRGRGAYSRETGVRLADAAIRRDGLLNISATFRYAAGPTRSPAELFDLSRRLVMGREPVFKHPQIGIELSAEQRIDRSNAITLSRERDALGCRRASLHWTIAEQELQTVAAFSQTLGAWIGRADLGRYAPISSATDAAARPMRDSLHHMGGTRMSADASQGVVDRNLRVHGAHNLSIVGGSVFPTGGHVNPTLTMLALSARLADRLSGTVGSSVLADVSAAPAKAACA